MAHEQPPDDGNQDQDQEQEQEQNEAQAQAQAQAQDHARGQYGSRRGRTLIELRQDADGEWTATQLGVETVGTGETAALAAMQYCRRIAAKTDATAD